MHIYTYTYTHTFAVEESIPTVSILTSLLSSCTGTNKVDSVRFGKLERGAKGVYGTHTNMRLPSLGGRAYGEVTSVYLGSAAKGSSKPQLVPSLDLNGLHSDYNHAGLYSI